MNDPVDPADPLKTLAFERDAARADVAKLSKQIADLQAKIPTAERLAQIDALEKAAAEAEDVRKRKEGEFDTWKSQIERDHARQIEAEAQKIADAVAAREALAKDIEDLLITNAFASASDWFGPTGKTVLVPTVAAPYLRQYVGVETYEADGRQARRIVVKGRDGKPILNLKTGQPADFSDALEQLIPTLPDRDSILRGSGKAGSGSSGGAGGTAAKDADLATITARAARGDAEAVKALKDRRSSIGGTQAGSAFDRKAS